MQKLAEGCMPFLYFLESIRNPFFDWFFGLITHLGEETFFLVIAILFFWCINKREGYFILLTGLIGTVVNQMAKLLFRIPRPWVLDPDFEIVEAAREEATGYSFPSGHTQNIAGTYGSICAYNPKKWKTALCVTIIVLVAFSRMYLGAHYPSDVIAGLLFGLVFAYLGNKLYDKVQNKHLLYTAFLLILTPFIIFFIIKPDPLYEDFFKLFGMQAGFTLAVVFEEKLVNLEKSKAVWKNILRIIICVVLALVIKEALKALFVTDILRLSLILDAVRYFVLVFLILGICPWVFKKVKI